MAQARPDASLETRIEELLAGMTLEEKLGQLNQLFYLGGVDTDSPEGAEQAEQPRMVEAELAAGRVGSLLFVSRPEEFNRLQRLALAGNRHGIPVMFGFDVIHGFRTILPVPVALAASWSPETAEAAQAVAAREARAAGVHWAFAPMVDIARDPRWGRIVEGAGEDPVLGAAMAAAQVRGFQGDDLAAPDRIMAGPKHFAGYGWAQGGRDYDESWISDAELHNVVLPPFRAAIEAGAQNIMTAYMPLNGVPATGSDWLLREVLRSQWGFDGFVVSDANAVRSLVVHGFARDLPDAGVRALRAGVDMEMSMGDPAYATLPDAATDGGAGVDERLVDESVRRVLEAKLRLGLFEHPFVDEQHAEQVMADPTHREVAREAAERSAVLLGNDGVLPLDPARLQRVAVLGPLADSQRDTLGPWVFAHDLDETVTIRAGLQQHLGDGVRVEWAPGVRPVQRRTPSIFDMWPGNAPADPVGFDDEAELARAVELAASSDVAVVVVGEWQNQIGENASRSSLALPGRQLELVQRVVATGTPVVVVLLNGRPLELDWIDRHAHAVLDAWYPGTSGGTAVARLLTGDAVPAGRLPFTWPRTSGQVPMVHSHLTSFEPENTTKRYWDVDGSPLYAFGHGLSYASFEYGPVRLDADRIGVRDLLTGAAITARVEVTNTSALDADEVVQLYVHQCWGTSARPVRQLAAFRRLPIAAGTTETLTFEIGRDQLRYWNAAARDWVLDTAEVEVAAGGSSTAPFTARFTVAD